MIRWDQLQFLPLEKQRELQNHLLRRYVREYLYPFSPHYRAVFDRVGVHPDKIRTVDDLRRLPFTSKQDLLPSEDQPQKFRDFILQPDPDTLKAAWPLSKKLPLLLKSWFKGKAAVKEQLRREFYPSFMTFTTGRSAEPVPFFYSPHDMRVLHRAGRRLIDVLEVAADVRIANMFPYAPHLAFWQVVCAGFEKGLMVLSTGGGRVMGSAGDLRAMTRTKAQVLLGVPGYVYHLLRRAVAEGHDLSNVNKVVLGAERVPPGMKAKIRAMLQECGAGEVQVLGTYGFTEARMAFAEAPTPDGSQTGYYCYPDFAITEVINPTTGEVLGPGEEGELVITPICGRASSVFRYRTGDMVRGGLITEPCKWTGRTIPRISNDIYRESSLKDLRLLKVKGTLVNLEDAAVLLGDMAEIEEWQIELQKKDNDPLEVDELVVHLAVRAGADEAQVRRKVEERLKSHMEISPNRVEFEDLPGMLDRIGMEREMKETRFLDSRPKV